MKTNQLLFGAAYYAEYLPYDRVEQDMEMMERAGMNVIRIAESTWSTLEPQEGIFDFSHIDKMLDAAARHHISVIIGTPTYAIPTWLVRKYPDILAITNQGQEIYGHRQNMDITHPQYLKHSEIVIRALMEHIKEVPHIIGFQLDNETKSYGTAGPRVQAMFVDYLKENFSDIEDFNREFGLDYWSNRVNCWEDFPDVRGTINQSLEAEFHKFQRLLVTRFLAWQAEIVAKYKRPDQFITQNFDFDWNDHSIGYQSEVNQYAAAECMTVAGCDIYHPSQGRLTGAEITFCGNISRSLKQANYLVLETQAQGNLTWLPYPKQLRLQAYSHIANGSNSVMYWHWHSIHNAIESYWKGVLSHDFSENETYREACLIGNEWKRIGSHLKNLQKTNHVAMLLDNNSLTGLRLFPFKDSGNYSYNTVARWIGDALYRLNIEFDMLPAEGYPLPNDPSAAVGTQTSSSSSRASTSSVNYEALFEPYEVLIVPALYSAADELLTALSNYVKNGGHLITTFRTGFSDEHIKIYPDTQPHLLHDCLGIHYNQFTYPDHVNVDGSTCKNWMELVICDTATPILTYEHPVWKEYAAVTKNNYGKGTSLYLATMFDEKLLEEILEDYLCDLPIAAFSTLSKRPSFPIIIKQGINDVGKNIAYYFNFSDEEKNVIYSGDDGIELITSNPVIQNDILTLSPWDLAIIES